MKSGERHFRDFSGPIEPVEGQQFAYTFDDIGNRIETVTNGRTATYQLDSNGHNQYGQRDVPPFLDVAGMASSAGNDVEVEVDGNPELVDYRYLEYFYHELDANNSGSYWLEEVTVRELDNGNVVDERSGWMFLAENPEEFDYDDDGNLLSDGRWDYTWDAENRLVKMEEVRSSVFPILRKFEFSYDYRGRRVKTSEWHLNPANFIWTLMEETKYVYSGWNLLMEVDAMNENDPIRSFLWGMDIQEMAGSPYMGEGLPGEPTGGVGALLAIRDHMDGDATYYALYDGHGNVMGLFDPVAPGTVAAEYDYGPFGETLRISGDAADVNPFRFSTKWHDEYADLYYYGYRYYSPSMGRFLNRDPIGEQGGLNLYGFVGNDPVNRSDYLGLVDLSFFYMTEIETTRVTYPNHILLEPFKRIFNGGVKTTQLVRVDPLDCEILASLKDIGLTIEYDPSTGEEVGRGRSSGDTITASAEMDDNCVCIVNMSGNEGNPLMRLAPGITYEVTIEIYPSNRRYDWEVRHDGFPSHHFREQGELYFFSHLDEGTTPLRLFPPMDQSASGSETY